MSHHKKINTSLHKVPQVLFVYVKHTQTGEYLQELLDEVNFPVHTVIQAQHAATEVMPNANKLVVLEVEDDADIALLHQLQRLHKAQLLPIVHHTSQIPKLRDAGFVQVLVRAYLNPIYLEQVLYSYIDTQVQRAYLSEIQALSKIGYGAYEHTTKQWTVSREAYQILGLPVATDNDLLEKLMQIVCPYQKDTFKRFIDHEWKDKTGDFTLRLEETPLAPERYVQFHFTNHYNKEGDIIRTSGVIQDVSLHIQREHELKNHRARYQMLFEQSRDMVFMSTENGQLVECNPIFLTEMGYNKKELETKGLSVLYPAEAVRTAMWKSIKAKGYLKNYPVQYVRKNGVFRECLVTANYVEQEAFTGMFGIIRDVTEEKQARQRQKEHELAVHSIKMREKLLAQVSHELRTPMHAVLGMAYALNETSLAPNQEVYVQTIMEGAQHLLAVISDLLQRSEVQDGKIQLRKEPFKITDALNRMSRVLGHSIRRKGLDLKLDIDTRLDQFVQGDATRLQQILINLVGNATKFTEKGAIEVRAEIMEQTESDIKVCFFVIDSGQGMPNEKLHSIFQSYVQLNQDVEQKYNGTGLGLSIVKELIKMHKGHIEVESTVGEGTTFKFCIRYPLRKQPPRKITSSITAENAKNLRVLVADDHPVNRLLVQQALTKHWPNIQIIEASDGQTSIQAAQKNKFDLVLLDLYMPGANGIEVAQKIRQQAYYQTVPIWLMTAEGLQNPEYYLKQGFDDFIMKPFKPQELIFKLQQYQKLQQA